MSGVQLFSFAMVAYGVLGLYVAGNKRVAGWWIGLSAQALWVVFAAITGLWAFYVSALAYGLVNARNLLRWRREQRRTRAALDRVGLGHVEVLPGGPR